MNITRRTYLTTAIPFVNGSPHLGHALELVQADVLARHRRARGDDVRLQTGKGITRFHAVYWPAILRSAGEPPPTAIYVHDYLTVEGQKIAKSLGTAIDPLDVVERSGSDALRWWFARDVPPSGDADVRDELLVARANELADGIGNLVNRTIALAARQPPPGNAQPAEPPPSAASRGDAGGDGRGLTSSEAAATAALVRRCAGLPGQVDEALRVFDLRAATAAVWELVAEANRYVSATRPWELAKSARAGDAGSGARLDAVLATLIAACSLIARELAPFLPEAAERIDRSLRELDATQGRALFRKLPLSRGDEVAGGAAAQAHVG